MQQCMERTATNRPKAWPESKPKGREKVWERSVGILYEVLRVQQEKKEVVLDSSMVEHTAVNRGVVGSSPTRGVKNDS